MDNIGLSCLLLLITVCSGQIALPDANTETVERNPWDPFQAESPETTYKCFMSGDTSGYSSWCGDNKDPSEEPDVYDQDAINEGLVNAINEHTDDVFNPDNYQPESIPANVQQASFTVPPSLLPVDNGQGNSLIQSIAQVPQVARMDNSLSASPQNALNIQPPAVTRRTGPPLASAPLVNGNVQTALDANALSAATQPAPPNLASIVQQRRANIRRAPSISSGLDKIDPLNPFTALAKPPPPPAPMDKPAPNPIAALFHLPKPTANPFASLFKPPVNPFTLSAKSRDPSTPLTPLEALFMPPAEKRRRYRLAQLTRQLTQAARDTKRT